MEQKEFNAILHRYLSNTATKKERQIVDQWFSNMETEKLDLSDTDKEHIKQRIRTVLQAHKASSSHIPVAEPKQRFLQLPKVWFKAAATIALLLIATYGIMNFNYSGLGIVAAKPEAEDYNVVAHQGKTPLEINLSDGSKIVLEQGAIVKYPQQFSDNIRTVSLEKGEAFFDIHRDENRPFIVQTHEVVTKVLGTSFSIRATPGGDVNVVVKSGRVSVSSKARTSKDTNTSHEVIVTANQQAYYDYKRDSLVSSLIESPKLITSNNMQIVNFNEAPVSEIFAALEQAFGVTIVYDKEIFKNCILTTSLTPDDDLFGRLDVICRILGVRYQIKGISVEIEGKGC